MMAGVVLFGLLFGIILLPTILSFVNPRHVKPVEVGTPMTPLPPGEEAAMLERTRNHGLRRHHRHHKRSMKDEEKKEGGKPVNVDEEIKKEEESEKKEAIDDSDDESIPKSLLLLKAIFRSKIAILLICQKRIVISLMYLEESWTIRHGIDWIMLQND